jgi:ribosome-associated protein
MTSPSEHPQPDDSSPDDTEAHNLHDAEVSAHEDSVHEDIDPPSPRPDRRTDTAQARLTHDFVIEAANHLTDLHCTDVIVFDVRNLSDLTDYIIIATGTSDRQIRSVSRDLEQVAKEYNLDKFGRDIDQNANWVVTDYVEVIVHLFDPAARAHYDLEMMWNDAPRIAYSRSPRPGAPGAADL